MSLVSYESSVILKSDSASATDSGIVNTSTQSFAGEKTFEDPTIFGNAGSNTSGIIVAGASYNSQSKTSQIGEGDQALQIYLRNSTVSPSTVIFSRSNSDTTVDGAVTNGMSLGNTLSLGYCSTYYNIFSNIVFQASSTGTISDSSSPGAIQFQVVQDGSNSLQNTLLLDQDGSVTSQLGGFVGDGSGLTNLKIISSIPETSSLVESLGTTNIDWSISNSFSFTLVDDLSISFSNQKSGQTITVRLTNTTSNHSVSWETAGILWSGGTAPTMSTGAVSDLYYFFFDGSNIFGTYFQNLS